MRAGQSLFVTGFAALVAMLVVGTSGCAAKRELVITSEPPGALVRLDDTVVGTTPYTTSFEAYGTRRITLYHTGYRTLSKVEDIDPPWYEVFPLDVVSEILIPVGWLDRHELDYRMVPESGTVTAPDLELILQRAEALRLAEPTGPRPTIPTHAIDVPATKPEPSGGTQSNGQEPATPPSSDPVKPSPLPDLPVPKQGTR